MYWDLLRYFIRVLLSISGVAILTLLAHSVVPVNASTAAFAYLLLVLSIAITWGFVEASLASVTATVALNYYFLPPIRTFTISDPQNWVALFSFLATSLVTSRLSAKAERRALDALTRKQDIERLYSFSRAILLIGGNEPFAKQLADKVVEIFEVESAVLYERRTGEMYRAGPADFDGLDEQLRDAAQHGSSYSDVARKRVITAVRLGAEPIGSLALQGVSMPDSVLQGIANLVAIGMERARAQDLAHQIEATRQSQLWRTMLIDAVAHEFKTPLTSIRAATSALLENPEPPGKNGTELLKIADEEAQHLTKLIDDALDTVRLDSTQIEIQWEEFDLCEAVHDLVASLRTMIEERVFQVDCRELTRAFRADQKLLKLALKQILENALKYSPSGSPVKIEVLERDSETAVAITNYGPQIPPEEQSRVFERFYRSPSIRKRIPGSGLGLNIAYRIAQAHGGDLTVSSRPDATTFKMVFPKEQKLVSP